MNYHRLPPKFDFPSNLLISTPASASTIKIASLRHEKASSLLKLPPIKSSKALGPALKRGDILAMVPDKYKSLTPDPKDPLESIKESADFSGSPLKRILMNNKGNTKENKSIEPHQRNLKENNGFLFELPNDFKLKSPMNEKTNTINLEKFKTPKSEQARLPKMQGRRLEGISELRLGQASFDDSQRGLMNSIKHRENHFQFFFNPSVLLSDQLLDKDELPKFEPSKCSSKKNGVIKAYSANTHLGLIRNYNEDRVAIILNIIKPQNKKVSEWPSCSFFAIYDGHGGSKCAEFLRDNLHHYVKHFFLNFNVHKRKYKVLIVPLNNLFRSLKTHSFPRTPKWL